MPTRNQAISPQWSRVVDASAEFFLLTHGWEQAVIEIASTANDATPPAANIRGHLLRGEMAITRFYLPTGAIWARIHPSAAPTASAVLIIDDY